MIQAGERISYVTIRIVGGACHVSAREGVMIEYGELNSKVKAKNGKIVWADTATIRPVGQKNALTEALFGKR